MALSSSVAKRTERAASRGRRGLDHFCRAKAGQFWRASKFTLDTGALIAFERGDRGVVQLVERALEELPVVVPAGAVGQAWRGGRRQARLARLLADVEVEPLDDARARAAGALCGATRTKDIIDASVVLCAKARAHSILTSDADDLRLVDRDVPLVPV